MNFLRDRIIVGAALAANNTLPSWGLAFPEFAAKAAAIKSSGSASSGSVKWMLSS